MKIIMFFSTNNEESKIIQKPPHYIFVISNLVSNVEQEIKRLLSTLKEKK